MKYKTIETLREVRLWTSQIIVPTIVGGIIVWTNPSSKYFIKEKINYIKSKFQKKNY